MPKTAFILKTLCILLFATSSAWAQVTTITDGPWNVGSTWSSGTVPDNTFGTITVNHIVNIPSGYSVTIDQTTVGPDGILQVDFGGTVTIANGTTDLDIQGIVDVMGTMINNNSAVITNTDGVNLTFGSGSVFQWLYTTSEGSIPLASWDPASTLLVTGYANNSQLNFVSPNWGQPFGNVTWDCPASNQNINFNGLLTDVQGDLSIVATGAALRSLNFSSTGSTAITIGGSFSISGTSHVQFTTTGTADFMIGGDFNFTSTNPNRTIAATTGTVNITTGGDFNVSAPGGSIRFASTGSTAVHTLNIGGDFVLTGSIVDETSANGVIVMNFNSGAGAVHNFLNSGTINACVQYYVGPADVLDLGTSFIIGSGGTLVQTGLTLDGTLRVGSLEATGAIATGSTLGNVRIPNAASAYRIYNPGSTIIYDGAGAQFMGGGHPASADVNVVIENPSGVTTATGTVTIDGDLTLTQGNLNVPATRTLALGGNVTANGNFITFTGASTGLSIYGDGDFGTFPFTNAAQSISAFTLNRTGSVTFARQVSLTGAVNLQSGTLIFDGQTLNLSGTFASTGGLLSSNNASTLNITGNGALGTLEFDPAGNTLNTLTFNRTTGGTATLDGTLTVTNAFNLTNGTFTNNAGLIMGNGSTLTRNAAGTLAANRPESTGSNVYNVIYTGGAMSTGLELPDLDDDLNNLTINGGPVTLAHNIFVNGIFDLNSSTFNANGFNISMEGSQWNDNAGTFTPGTGIVIFNQPSGTLVGGSTVPTFGNIQLNGGGATLTFPSGNVLVSGNLQFTAGGTFNANGGTITMNAAVNQFIAGAGLTINNLTLTKGSSSDVVLQSAMNMTGALSITSSNTDFASGGLLTLISTSDAASGNASVQPLLNGASVSGNVTTQRYMSAEGRIYRYISSPITNAPVSQIQDDFPVTGTFSGSSICSTCLTNASMFSFNAATSTYVAFPTTSNTQTLTPGVGYSAYVRQDVVVTPVTLDFTGPINQGTVVMPVAFNASATESWSLVGNPFPATIDWDILAGWTKTNIAAQIAIRDNGAGGVYNYWDGATGGITGGQIAAGQGFLVRSTTASPALSVNENAKTPFTGAFIREDIVTPDVLVVGIASASNVKIADKAYIRIRPDATNDYDNADAPKLSNDYFSFSSKTSNGKRVAINAVNSLSCGSQLTLDISFAKLANGNYAVNPVGSYTLNMEKIGRVKGYDVTLVDQFTSTSTLVDEDDTYTFSITSDVKSLASDRFRVVFSEETPSTVNVSGSGAVCENSVASINIENADSHVTYQLTYKGNVIKEFSGAESHVAEVNGALLEENENVVVVNALGSCGSIFPAGQVILKKSDLLTATVLPVMPVCGTGKATLTATGNPSTRYNWYETSDATIAVAEATESFETPSLSKSRLYYVSAVNEGGCEGPRTEVAVKVVPAEPIALVVEGDDLVTDQSGTMEWYFDDVKIQGAVDSRFTPEKSGYYSVSKVNGGCVSSASKVYFEYIYREGLPFGVALFPNPVQHNLRLNYPEKAELKRAALYNNAGIFIKEFTLELNDGKINGEIDVRNLPVGIYIVKIFGEKEVIAIKVVKE